MSVGDDQALLHAISILLGSDIEVVVGKLIGTSEKQEIMDLLEDTASSHLLEVASSPTRIIFLVYLIFLYYLI